MRIKLLLALIATCSVLIIKAQTEFTLHVYYAQNQPVDEELYGVHLSGFLRGRVPLKVRAGCLLPLKINKSGKTLRPMIENLMCNWNIIKF